MFLELESAEASFLMGIIKKFVNRFIIKITNANNED